jgi:hypothetical protein
LPKRFYEALISASLPIDKQGALHYEIKPSLPLGCSAGSKSSEQTKGSPSGKKRRMPRTKKKTASRPAKDRSQNYFDDTPPEEAEDEDLPSDEAGRRKIKKNYEELLGIRIEKLKGRVLNREKINKSIDGLYFICFECKKICHNLDEGWVEEATTQNNFCGACAKAKGIRSAAA